jgi:hypothetical protein
MKRRSIITFCLSVAVALVPNFNIAAQQNAKTEKSTRRASLDSSLGQLGQELKESVAIDFRHGYYRRTFVRLKRRDGCKITFQVSLVPSLSSANEPYIPATGLGYAEWRVNLSDLDVAEVWIEAPGASAPKGDDSVIRFATAGGKASIKWNGFGVGDSRWASEGRIDVSEKYAPQVIATLQQAIMACKE